MKDIPLDRNEMPEKTVNSKVDGQDADDGYLPFLKPEKMPFGDMAEESFTTPREADASPEPAAERAQQRKAAEPARAARWEPAGRGVPLLGGTLYTDEENDGAITVFRYVVTCEEKALVQHTRSELLYAHAADLAEFFPYRTMKKDKDSDTYVLTFYTAASDRPVSLRTMLKDRNHEPDVDAIREKLLCLLAKLYNIPTKALGVFSLDTVFVDRKGRLRILPIGVERPPEYPTDNDRSADLYAAVLLTEELLQRSERPEGLLAPSDELLLRCLLPVSMRPQLPELLAYLGLDEETDTSAGSYRSKPVQQTPAARTKTGGGGFLNKACSFLRKFVENEKIDSVQESTGTQRETL